jgi:hypothetical protein
MKQVRELILCSILIISLITAVATLIVSFTTPLDSETQQRVETCQHRLRDQPGCSGGIGCFDTCGMMEQASAGFKATWPWNLLSIPGLIITVFLYDRYSTSGIQPGSPTESSELPIPKYGVGERVILLEQTPEDGFTICVVERKIFSGHEWAYDLRIIGGTHYDTNAIGGLYHCAPESRIRST